MLVENVTLLLAASDFLSEASWDSMTLPTSVLCSFFLGESFCPQHLYRGINQSNSVNNNNDSKRYGIKTLKNDYMTAKVENSSSEMSETVKII